MITHSTLKTANALVSFAFALCVTFTAEAEELIEFRIPPQSLESALLQFSDLTGAQVVTSSVSIAQMRSNGVSGKLSPRSALARLIDGSDLEIRSSGERSFALATTPAEKAQPSSPPDPPVGSTDSQQREPQNEENAGQHKTGADTRLLETVFVTAQKREERLIDVPISIVALSGEQMKDRRIDNLDQLPAVVPGLSVEGVGWQRRVMLRGIGNVQGNASLIGLYLDEAAVTTTSVAQLDLATYDLERVEVLRGPQGTLYGEGSAGGTLRFITRDPDLTGFGMNADLTASFIKNGSWDQRVAAVLNAPLIENELGFRIAGTYDHDNGWIDQPAAGKKDINGQNRRNVRIKGLWQPNERFALEAMSVIHRNDTSTGTGEDTNGNFRQVFNLTTAPRIEDDYEIHNLSLTYDFSTVRLLNTISYVDQDRAASQVGHTFPTNPELAVRDVLQNPYRLLSEVLTEELRFMSTGAGPWQWTLGGTFRDARFDVRQQFNFGFPTLPGAPLPAAVSNDNLTESKAWAVFGDANYKLTDRLTIGAGLRYYEDDQEYRTATLQKGTFDTVNPRAYAQYKFNDDFNIYTSAAKGFRSGGFNALNQPPFDPETIWTYELGTKMSLMNGTMFTDVAIFYSDYSDYQVVGVPLPPSPPLNITSNAGSARIRGIEWQMSWRPADQWSIGFNGDYLDTEFREIKATRTSFIVGDPVPLVPEYSLNVPIQRDFDWNGRAGFLRLDYSIQGRMSYQNRSIGTLYQGESGVIQMLNFSTDVEVNPHLSIMLFAQNILDDREFTSPYHFMNNSVRVRPRSFGIQFRTMY